MRFKSTWILLAVLTLIAAYYFLVDETIRLTRDRDRRDSKKVLPYGRNEIDRFVLVNPYSDRIELEREGTEWMIVSPVRTDAAQSTIDAMLTQLLPGHKLELFAGVTDLSPYGLEEPYATLIFHPVNGDRPDTLFVGDKTPTSPSCYVRIGVSDTVLIVREMTHDVVDKNLYHLRDKNFLYIPSSTIDSFRIDDDGYSRTLSRMFTGWRMSKSGIWANDVLVESYLSGLTLAIVRGFAREDLDSLGAYGLDPPSGEISIFQAGEEIRISFGARKGDLVHATRTGIDKVLLLEEKFFSILDWTLDEMRSKILSFFEPADVKEIICEFPNRTITLLREPSGWSSSGIPVELEKPLNILRMIKAARFESFTEKLDDGLSGPKGPFSLRITLKGSGGEQLEKITFYSTSSGLEEASSSSAGMRGNIAPGILTEIERYLDSF